MERMSNLLRMERKHPSAERHLVMHPFSSEEHPVMGMELSIKCRPPQEGPLADEPQFNLEPALGWKILFIMVVMITPKCHVVVQ